MSQGQVRTESGLVVPASAVAKTQRVLPKDTLKRVGRFVREMRAEGIQIILGCTHCKTAIDLALVDQLDDTQAGGRPVFTCKCSERVVR